MVIVSMEYRVNGMVPYAILAEAGNTDEHRAYGSAVCCFEVRDQEELMGR
jgi:hypothetical protein